MDWSGENFSGNLAASRCFSKAQQQQRDSGTIRLEPANRSTAGDMMYLISIDNTVIAIGCQEKIKISMAALALTTAPIAVMLNHS
jgi:hypothetical protein